MLGITDVASELCPNGRASVLVCPRLIHDMSLLDNLLALEFLTGRSVSSSVLEEISQFFALCGFPLDFDRASSTWASDATPTQRFQICVGRALLLRPEHLDIELSDWTSEMALTPRQLADVYEAFFPWRTLTLIQEGRAVKGPIRGDSCHG